MRELGKGGMAEAFEARAVGARGFMRVVAVKRPLPASSKETLDAFLNEARLAARITHPNVVQIVDLDLDSDGKPFMAMEFVDGCNLAELLERVPRPSSTVSIYVVASVLRGLAAAHSLTTENGRELRIVHRDISPHNVFLSRDGMVKVGDWGIAKATGITTPLDGATKPGHVKGKFAYMAPEQLSGAPVDHRADLYAVGLMLWEMLTGCTHEERAGMFARKTEAPSIVNPDVPAEIESVVMRLLEKDLHHRYNDAFEAIREIEACADARVDACDELADLVASAPRRSRSKRVASTIASRRFRASARRRAVTLLAVVAAAGVAGAVVIAATRTATHRPARSPSATDASPDAPAGEQPAPDASIVPTGSADVFVAIPDAQVDAQLAPVSKMAYEEFRQRLSSESATAMAPLGDNGAPPSAPVTWVTFTQATRYCLALQARLPTSEEWATLVTARGSKPVVSVSEWTSTIKEGRSLVREPHDRRTSPSDPLYKVTTAGTGEDPDVVAGRQIGFRCVR